jgi:hypothetical protein
MILDETFSDTSEAAGRGIKEGPGMKRHRPIGQGFLFFLLIVFCGAAAGCNTLKPKHLQGGNAGEDYQYFLSKSIELRLDYTGGEFALSPDSPITIVEKNGVINLRGAAAADSTDIVTISSNTPGRLRITDGIRQERGQTNSGEYLNVMVIRIVFGDNNDEFLEFAGVENTFDNNKFYLLFFQDPQNRDRKKNYVMYKGQKYLLSFLTNGFLFLKERPYILTKPPM